MYKIFLQHNDTGHTAMFFKQKTWAFLGQHRTSVRIVLAAIIIKWAAIMNKIIPQNVEYQNPNPDEVL